MATPGFFGFLLIVGRSWGLVASSGRVGGACDGGLAATGMAGEDATIDDEVDARPGDDRGQAFEKLARLEEDVRGAVGPGAGKFEDDEAVIA
jgi:hypothetical protein